MHFTESNHHSAARILLLLGTLLLATERRAEAYTDPGSGALIWQMLVAGFFGAMFYFRNMLAWVRRKTGDKK